MSKHNLQVGHLNVYHLVNKVPDVCVLLNQSSQPVHVFGMSETRLDSRIADTLIYIPQYSVLRRDSAKKNHTGIAVYIHDSISNFATRRTELEDENIECIWIEVKHGKSSPLLIGYVYRNPAETSSWSEDFIQMMDKVKSRNKDIVLLGDFNINLNNAQTIWNSTTTLLGLHQLVLNPTRITDTTATLIDHIYTDNKKIVSNVYVSNSSISDHRPIFCSVSMCLPKSGPKGHTTIAYRSFKNFDESAFFRDLSEAPFHSVFHFSVADDAFNHFYNILSTIIDKHVPMRQHRVKHARLPPWLTSDII
ncbi:MAG: endonuclease/exonuclease/phosphatase family protein, partial [Maribacter sp.]|uniref:endonuclease/exonuclease/phosphatase family protein n=1 Tax=Maribacter sp. TaxID=1897614 RepID=UPI003C75AA8B